MEPKLYHYGVEFSITQTPIEKKRLHSHCRFGIIVFSLSDFIPMMPPICAICYRDFRHSSDEGGLLRFKLTDAQKEFNKRFEQPGFVGHKKGDYWFCGEHYAEAKKITHLSSAEALKILRNLG